MTILTPANAFPNLAFPQHGSGQTNTVQSFTYPGAVWPQATGPAVLSYTNAFPNRVITARSFNGIGDYINIGTPAVLDITGALTFSIWANAASFPAAGANFAVLMGKGYDGTKEQTILRYSGRTLAAGNAQRLQILYFDGANAHGAEWAYTNTTGSWFHILGQWTGSAWTLYNNGISIGTTGGTQIAPVHAAAAFRIGAEDLNGTPARFFNGSLADPAVWNIALTPTQISSLASGQRANTIGANANLVGDWPISGLSPEPDISGNGNDGTLTGTSITAGPPQLSSYPATGLAFPQHGSGLTNTVQDFLYPGAVQPQVPAGAFMVFSQQKIIIPILMTVPVSVTVT